MRNALTVLVLLAGAALIAWLTSEDAPRREMRETRSEVRLPGVPGLLTTGTTRGRADPRASRRGNRQARRMPRISPTLFVRDGRPPDHPTSYRIQERVWRYLHAVDDPHKRAAARRLIERLMEIRKQEGEVLR